MEKEIRIIAAVIHHDTNEVEIVVEEKFDKGIDTHFKLSSRWIDCDELFEK